MSVDKFVRTLKGFPSVVADKVGEISSDLMVSELNDRYAVAVADFATARNDFTASDARGENENYMKRKADAVADAVAGLYKAVEDLTAVDGQSVPASALGYLEEAEELLGSDALLESSPDASGMYEVYKQVRADLRERLKGPKVDGYSVSIEAHL